MRAIGIFILLLFTAAAMGDVVHLKDGTLVEGDVVKAEAGHWKVTQKDGRVVNITADRVSSIELKKKAATTQMADALLASLRRSVEHETDIPPVLDRYHRFIQVNKDTSVAAEAQKDVAVWQDRLDRGLIKYGDRWVTPDELKQLQAQDATIIEDVREMLKTGKLKEAASALKRILADAPANTSALYLQGLLLYGRGQLPAARKAFESVNALTPDHGPTLNNLAVILWRQNEHVAALNDYDRAMTLSPQNQRILDNVAAALQTLPAKLRDNPAVDRVGRLFTLQDSKLRAKMAQAGWYRWGSTWVSRAQYEQIQAVQEQVQRNLNALSKEFDATKAQVAQIDRDLDTNNRQMRLLESSSFLRDVDGNLYPIPLPPSYYQMQRDNDRMKDQRAAAADKLERLRRAAQAEQRKMPAPPSAGYQQLIQTEGTPLMTGRPPASPAIHTPAPAVGPAKAHPSAEPATRPFGPPSPG